MSEIFDLSSNALTGIIPSELSKFRGVVRLSGNTDFKTPAPLDLCLLDKFDSAKDTRLCPAERTALSTFYHTAKGEEWTINTNWLSQYDSHCDWHGITCHGESVIELNLANNGLSGMLSKEIKKLRSLTYLNVADNDMKGGIPTEIGLLKSLTFLKLNHNLFVLSIPSEIEHLTQLKLLHLHSNRVTGGIVLANLQPGFGESSFITDCGSPSIYIPIKCEGCTMCCNADKKCYPQEEPRLLQVQLPGFQSYSSFSLVLLAIMMGLCCFLVLMSYSWDFIKTSQSPQQTQFSFRGLKRLSSRYLFSQSKADEKYALEHLGKGSVYSFFLSESVVGWLIALATVFSQIVMLVPYIQASEFDLGALQDIEYSWSCNPSDNRCIDTNGVTNMGYTIFVILMIVFLSTDLICGLKLVVLSGKRRHSHSVRARFFIGGIALCSVTMYIVYVSTLYIMATARSDTDVVTDAVIILFITDIDEKVFDLLQANGSSLTNKLQDKDTEENSKDHPLQGASAPVRPARGEEEEEKVEEQVEDGSVFKQDFQIRKVSVLTRENAELNERLEKLDKEQDIEQNNEEQGTLRLQEQVETLSHTVVRMELEMKLLKMTLEQFQV